MAILGLQALHYAFPEPEHAVRFLRDWNLAEQPAHGAARSFATTEGARLTLWAEHAPELPPPVAAGIALREIVWAVDTPAALDALMRALPEHAGATRDAEGTIHAADPNGYGVAFALSTLEQLPPVDGDVNFPGKPVRRNRAVDFDARPTVRHLGHVAIFVPDLEAATRFYVDVLDFRASDVYPGRGIFLRAPGSHDHHNIFLVNRAQPGLHHMSFEVAEFHEVMLGGLHMRRQGWKTQTGPGRHRLGSNYFWYFHTPFGGSCEYYSDMDYLDDSWKTRSWDYTPDMIAAWTTQMPDLPAAN